MAVLGVCCETSVEDSGRYQPTSPRVNLGMVDACNVIRDETSESTSQGTTRDEETDALERRKEGRQSDHACGASHSLERTFAISDLRYQTVK